MSINNTVRRAFTALNFPQIPKGIPSGIFVVRPTQAGKSSTPRTIKFYPDGLTGKDTFKFSDTIKGKLSDAFEDHPDAAYRYKNDGKTTSIEGKTTDGHVVSYKKWLGGIVASTASNSQTGVVKMAMYPSETPGTVATVEEESIKLADAKNRSLKLKKEIASALSRPMPPAVIIPHTTVVTVPAKSFMDYLPSFSFWKTEAQVPAKPITVEHPLPSSPQPVSLDHQLTLGEAAGVAVLYKGMGKRKAQAAPVQALFNRDYVPIPTGHVPKTRIDLKQILPQGGGVIRQRNTGNCYLLAALKATLESKTGYEALTSSSLVFETNEAGEKIYQLTFPTGLTAKVHEAELGKTAASGNKPLDGSTILQLFELTYAKAMNEKSANPLPPEDVLKGIEGGKEHVALKNMLGGSVIPDTESTKEMQKVLARKQRRNANTSYILSAYTGSNNQKPITGTLSSGQKVRLPNNHAYALLVDPYGKGLRVVDPHDTKAKIYAMGFQTFGRFFKGINGIQLPKVSSQP